MKAKKSANLQNLDLFPKGKGRGGTRVGAGRKKVEACITMRVPKSLQAEVKALIKAHKKARLKNITTIKEHTT